MKENNNLDWLDTFGEYSSKGCSLQYNKDFYDMLGIINVTIPVGDKESGNYKLYRSKLQENHIEEEVFCDVEKSGKIFLNAIKSIGADEESYNKLRPRDKNENLVMYNNIRKDEESYWKGFFDKLNVEYRIEEYAFCWWSDELLPKKYKSVWVNEEQFKLIENTEKYMNALQELHKSIEKHILVEKNKYGSHEEQDKRKKAYESGMEKLNNLVGLSEIKGALKERIAYVSWAQRAKELGIKVGNEASNHMIITGNPGTGKTVVARILAEIYYGLGVLKTNTFVETNRTELLGAYIGHTEKNVEKVFNQVIQAGGLIFIDEFHQLCDGEDSKGFGNKAINSIVTYLENYRDKFVLVAAGYPKEMARALNHDPGLEQRFSTKVNFPDYSKAEVFEIFKNLCTQNNLKLDENNYRKILDMFDTLPEGGNGRMARDIYEHTLLKSALRIFEMGNISDERFKKECTTITVNDVKNSINDVSSKYNKNKDEPKKIIGFRPEKKKDTETKVEETVPLPLPKVQESIEYELI